MSIVYYAEAVGEEYKITLLNKQSNKLSFR